MRTVRGVVLIKNVQSMLLKMNLLITLMEIIIRKELLKKIKLDTCILSNLRNTLPSVKFYTLTRFFRKKIGDPASRAAFSPCHNGYDGAFPLLARRGFTNCYINFFIKTNGSRSAPFPPLIPLME